MKCAACSSTGPLRRFEIRVDGSPLRLAPDLCDVHGDAFLIRVGTVLGELIRESGDSLPAAVRFDPRDLAAIASAGGYDPPVLNKSGGSHVHRAVPGPGTTTGRELCEECGEWFSNL